MKKLNFLLLFLLAAFCITSFAQPSPLPMLQSTSDQMLAALRNNQAVLKTKPPVVYGIIRRILLPHFDTKGMAKTALGKAWITATPAQQQRFTQEFTTLLVRTYSVAFAQYTNEQVRFFPPRGNVSGQTNLQIDSQITRPTGQQISVAYHLSFQGGQWKVYDFSVEGISMIESFRSQFAAQLSQGNLNDLIQQLIQRNARPQRFDS